LANATLAQDQSKLLHFNSYPKSNRQMQLINNHRVFHMFPVLFALTSRMPYDGTVTNL